MDAAAYILNAGPLCDGRCSPATREYESLGHSAEQVINAQPGIGTRELIHKIGGCLTFAEAVAAVSRESRLRGYGADPIGCWWTSATSEHVASFIRDDRVTPMCLEFTFPSTPERRTSIMPDTTNHPRGRFVHGGLTLRPAELPDPRLASPGTVYQDAAGQYWRIAITPAGGRAERDSVQHWSRVTPISERQSKHLETAKTALALLAVLAAMILFIIHLSGSFKFDLADGGFVFDQPAATPGATALIASLAALAAAFLAIALYVGQTVKLTETDYHEWRIEQRELARIRRGLPALDASHSQGSPAGGES